MAITNKKIIEMEYYGEITGEQGYELRRLNEEGYDITEGLKGRIAGIKRVFAMSECIREHNGEGVEELINDTKEEEEEFRRLTEEHLKRIEEIKMKADK